MSTEDLATPAERPPLVRLPGWPERLAFFLATRALLPFAWGLNDCALFAADWVSECTGVDLAADLRGAYGSEREAARVLHLHGGLLAIAQARLPQYAVPPGGNVQYLMRRGDVVCVEVEVGAGDQTHLRPTMGIVAGNGMWAAPGEHGAVYRPVAEVQHAFAVG